jgi:uncharacterized protein YqfA (UPF0365 family)
MSGFLIFFGIVAAIIILVVGLMSLNFLMIWIRAWTSGAPVSFVNLIAMRLRGIPTPLIVNARITAVRAGINITTDQLETHYLSSGNVNEVIRALIASDKAGISLDYNRACAIDLATSGSGKSVFEAVRTSVNPRVIHYRRRSKRRYRPPR